MPVRAMWCFALYLAAAGCGDTPMPWYLPDPPVVKKPRPARMAPGEEPPLTGEAGADAFGYPLRHPDRAVLLDALRARRFDLLERWMAFFQTEFERDYHKENWPDTMLSAFFVADPDLGKLLDEWVAHSPKHFAPWAARGSYWFRLAGHYRGSEYLSKTSWAQLSKEEELAEKAARDFGRALELEPQLVALHRRLMQIAKTKPNLGQRGWLDAGVKQCRLCYYLRATYVDRLAPRWGGSVQEMKQYIRELQPLVRENPKLKLLGGFVELDRCRTLREAGERKRALQACDASLAFGDAATFLLERSYLHNAKDDPLSVLPFLDRTLRLHPQEPNALARRFLARAQRRESHLDAARDMLALRRVDPTHRIGADNVIWMLNTLLHDGDELAAAGKHAEALTYYEIGLALGPGDRLLTKHAEASRKAVAPAP